MKLKASSFHIGIVTKGCVRFSAKRGLKAKACVEIPCRFESGEESQNPIHTATPHDGSVHVEHGRREPSCGQVCTFLQLLDRLLARRCSRAVLSFLVFQFPLFVVLQW